MSAQLVGRTWAVDLGQLKLRLTYESITTMTFVVIDGGGLADNGHSETVDVQITEIRPQVFLTSWQEAGGATVVHVGDLEGRTVHSTVTMAGRLVRLSGSFTEVTMSNKDILLTAMRELFVEKDLTALDRYWADPYIQHSPGLPNGTDGLRAAVPTLEGFSWNPVRIFQDGDYVITHSLTTGWIPEGDAAIVDIFRFENGRIAEHWDVVQPHVPDDQTASGNPMV